jgi:hypothetical protein
MSNKEHIEKNVEYEEPIFIIEHDEEQQDTLPVRKTYHRKTLFGIFLIFGILLGISIAYTGYKVWTNYNSIGISISVSPQKNIEKLEKPLSNQQRKEKANILLTKDTILQVELNIYELKGVQASIEFTEPSESDKNVYLYSHCADYTPDGKYLGTLVHQGEQKSSLSKRLGYMAMLNGQYVIGISPSEAVMKHVKEKGGDFFRQFILVSDGELPSKYYLHGKVERCAMGRTRDNKIYFIASQKKETIYGFADALREYGFIDAIYLTGGGLYAFYRDEYGMPHSIYPASKQKDKYTGITPYLVFRKRGV